MLAGMFDVSGRPIESTRVGLTSTGQQQQMAVDEPETESE